MKQTAKRILAFVSVVCIAFLGIVTMPFVQVNAAEQTETLNIYGTTGTLASDKLSISWTSGDVSFANKKGSTAIRTDDSDHYRVYSGSSVTISTSEGTISEVVITCTNADYAKVCQSSIGSAVSVSVSGSAVTVEAVGKAELTFKASAQFRLNKVEVTYEIATDDPTVTEIKEGLNAVTAKMSMGYKYTQDTDTEEQEKSITDKLDREFTGVAQATNYATWSGKTAMSSAVYAGNSAGDGDTIQLRSNNSNSGIVTTTSGGKATKVVLVWNSKSATGRTVDIFGKSTAYTQATDLYNSSTRGTKLGSIVCGTSTEFVINGDYEYIGIRSNSGALYLTSIEITWSTGEGTEMVEKTVLSNSEFRIKCGVDASLDLSGIDGVEYGIYVSAENGNEKYYASDSEFLQIDETAGIKYVVISLGDIVNDKAKSTTVFTVRAYAKYKDEIYMSTNFKAHSVASLVKEYYGMVGVKEQVEVLYDYFDDNGII